MSNFSVQSRAAGSMQVLDLEGELDAHTASQLEAAFETCLDEGRYRIVVNGEALDYISSAGLGVFMAFVEEVREEGGDIKVAALQPKVYNVFDLLGFPMLFDIEETEEDARARFENQPADDPPADDERTASPPAEEAAPDENAR